MTRNHMENQVGVGFKSRHFDDILGDPGRIGWAEIHAENYMSAGGANIARLEKIREIMPVSCHGVGLSIGGSDPLDTDHLARLKKLNDWLQPFVFSEHLAWSSHGQNYYNDLLPLPYNTETLAQVCTHIAQVQDTLNRQMLLENPSNYLGFEQSTMSEIDFIKEIVRRTGCELLLDVNNVHISAVNQKTSARDYLDAYPIDHIGEIHLGGHEQDADEDGAPLLIDTHSRAVANPVWALYQELIQKTGTRPTLIEWDNDVPEWRVLAADVDAARTILTRKTRDAA